MRLPTNSMGTNGLCSFAFSVIFVVWSQCVSFVCCSRIVRFVINRALWTSRQVLSGPHLTRKATCRGAEPRPLFVRKPLSQPCLTPHRPEHNGAHSRHWPVLRESRADAADEFSDGRQRHHRRHRLCRTTAAIPMRKHRSHNSQNKPERTNELKLRRLTYCDWRS